MCTPNSPRSGDGRSAVAQVAAGLLLATAFTVLWAVFKPRIDAPLSTDIVFVDRDSAVPLAVPEDLPSAGRAGGPVVRIGFVGDIMQHLAQATDDFAASYARVAPLIEGFDLAVGNLEFPVDPSRPVGPPFG